MYQHEHHREELCEFVDGATSINDLVAILKQVDLAAVKTLIKEQLKTTKNFPYLSLLSMTKVFPIDVVQHIISFNNFSGMKCVNKAFNQCFQKNKKKELKHREHAIKKSICCSTVARKTWVVEPSDDEDSLLLISEAIKRAKGGDRIVINHGKFRNLYNDSSLIVDKKMEIVGAGASRVRVQIGWDNLDIKANVYLKNLTIDVDRINVHAGASLFLEHCTLTYSGDGGIFVNSKASCFAFNCTLEQIDDVASYAFYGYTRAKICVHGCELTGFGGREDDPQPCIGMDDISGDCQLSVVDSVFKDCRGPIVNGNSDVVSEKHVKLQANRREYAYSFDRRICFA